MKRAASAACHARRAANVQQQISLLKSVGWGHLAQGQTLVALCALWDSLRKGTKAAACRAHPASFAYRISFRSPAQVASFQRAVNEIAQNALLGITQIPEPRCVRHAPQDLTVLVNAMGSQVFHCRARPASFQKQARVPALPAVPVLIQSQMWLHVRLVLQATTVHQVLGHYPVLQEQFASTIVLLVVCALLDILLSKRPAQLACHVPRANSATNQEQLCPNHVQQAGSRAEGYPTVLRVLPAHSQAAMPQTVCHAQVVPNVVELLLRQCNAHLEPFQQQNRPFAPRVPKAPTQVLEPASAMCALLACAV